MENGLFQSSADGTLNPGVITSSQHLEWLRKRGISILLRENTRWVCHSCVGFCNYRRNILYITIACTFLLSLFLLIITTEIFFFHFCADKSNYSKCNTFHGDMSPIIRPFQANDKQSSSPNSTTTHMNSTHIIVLHFLSFCKQWIMAEVKHSDHHKDNMWEFTDLHIQVPTLFIGWIYRDFIRIY